MMKRNVSGDAPCSPCEPSEPHEHRGNTDGQSAAVSDQLQPKLLSSLKIHQI